MSTEAFYLDIYIYIFSRNTLKLFLRLTFNITTGTLAASSINLLANTGGLFPKNDFCSDILDDVALMLTGLYLSRSRWQ